LDLKQARTETQISQLKANTPAFSRGDNYNAQLNYYETILKNVARERAQLEAIIRGTKPVLDLAEDEVDESNQQTHVATSAAADAGSAPRTLDTQAAAVNTGDNDASNGSGNNEGKQAYQQLCTQKPTDVD
jgi:cysteinyl-tRNA synthetase